MKIAIVGDFYNNGGIQNHIRNLSTELSYKKNIEIHIISTADKDDTINIDKLKIHLIKESVVSNLPVVSVFGCMISSSLIIKKLIAINPDIVHIHGTYLPYSKVAVVSKKLRFPVILTMHGSMLQETKSTSKFPKRQCIYLKLLPNFYYEKKALKYVDKIITVSEPIKKLLDNVIGDRSKILVIPNGVSPAYLQENPNIVALQHPSILFVGRLVKVKGCDTLIKAIPLITNFIPDVHLYIAGDGNQRKKLEMLAHTLGVSKNISFLGHLPERKLAELYSSVDLYIVPSKYELFGITLLEAMACGKPILASNVGGIPSIVIDKETGYLFSSNDLHDLVMKAVELLHSEKLCIKFGEKGRERVKTEYDWQIIAERVFKLYIECFYEYHKENS